MVFKSTSHKAARSDAVKSFSRTPAIVSELHAEPARAALFARPDALPALLVILESNVALTW
jgi:hypothetical protein